MAPKTTKGKIGKAISPKHDGRQTESSILRELGQMPKKPKLPY
jgi:hypothetical protein